MKAFVAIDSFKGCLSSSEANEAACTGLRRAGLAADDITLLPMSDGGEGFCDTVSCYLDHSISVQLPVHGPDGREILASYLIDGRTAYIESAAACGYTLVPDGSRTPLKTSSYGLGELLKDAMSRKMDKVVIGMGGTATCDGGVGMLQALGAVFLTEDGILPDGAPAMLSSICSMDCSSLIRTDCPLEAWSDTRTAFCGPSGAVRLFGAQKGITDDMSDSAESWMASLSSLYGLDPLTFEGAGAAGGIGGALASILGAGIRSGADEMVRLSGLAESLSARAPEMTIVITGEGRFDTQTLTGKLPCIVAETADRFKTLFPEGALKLICLAGSVMTRDSGPFDSVIRTTPDDMDLETAMKKENASDLLAEAACRAVECLTLPI